MPRLRRLLAAAAVAAAPTVAAAEASHLGEETEIADPGDCQLEVAHARERQRGGPRSSASTLQLGCGVGANTELEAQLAGVRTGAVHGRVLALEARTLLHQAGPLAVTLAYGTTAERAGTRRWRRSSHFAAAELTYLWRETWVLEAVLGTERDRDDRRDRTIWALVAEHAVAQAVELRAQVEGVDRRRPLWGLGLRWNAWPDVAFATLKHSWRGGARGERTTGVAVTFEF